MRKKAEGQKCIRLGFTIEPEMGRAFLDKVQKDGISQSSAFAAMVNSYLSGSIGSIGLIGLTDTNNHQSEIDELKAELKRLSSVVTELQSAKVARNTSLTDYIDSTDTTQQTQKPGIDVLPVTPIEVSPEPITVNSVPGNEVSVKKPVIVKNSRLNKHFEGDVPVFVQTFEEWMKNKGYTQKSFQDAYGFSLSAVSKWKNGSRPLPMDKYDLISAIMKGEILPSKED